MYFISQNGVCEAQKAKKCWCWFPKLYSGLFLSKIPSVMNLKCYDTRHLLTRRDHNLIWSASVADPALSLLLLPFVFLLLLLLLSVMLVVIGGTGIPAKMQNVTVRVDFGTKASFIWLFLQLLRKKTNALVGKDVWEQNLQNKICVPHVRHHVMKQ